mmetsp:Transcript_44634/g.51371  ORF Transcript_44634/g.51371 Transcript_44634/m.51371 type:complete len:245 (+) Transcript_44634:2-736(+)
MKREWLISKLKEKISCGGAYVDLGGEGLGPQAISVLAEGLKCNRTMEQLFFLFSDIGTKGSEALASMLLINNTLKQLSLLTSNITPQGIRALSNALIKNNTLNYIDLGGNAEIGSEGIKPLLTVLSGANTTITTLRMAQINLGVEGMEFVADMLRVNGSIEDLSVMDDQIENKGAILFAKALKINRGLVNVNLMCNNIGYECAIVIAKSLEGNEVVKQIMIYGDYPDQVHDKIKAIDARVLTEA